MDVNEVKMVISKDLQLMPSEKEAVEEMSRRFSKDLPRKMNDEAFMYYRFLKARDFDIDAAEQMLRESLKWRKDNNVDTILTDYKPPEALQNYFENFFFGYDKEGCPVYYLPFGKKDIRKEWKEALLELIDADQLPVFLGGTRTDPDGNPLGKTFMNQGGKTSEKYYLQKSVSSLENSPGVKKITLSHASFQEVAVEIDEPGSLIEWEFETRTRDIGFGLFYKDMDGEEEKMTELVELQRLETEYFSEVGMYKCDKSGIYVILFDNSYSLLRSKEVYYRINVVRSSDHEKNLKN